ncbi:MAG: TonB-dependent receptor [Polyangiaceae bacterium]|jgi:TonB family protein
MMRAERAWRLVLAAVLVADVVRAQGRSSPPVPPVTEVRDTRPVTKLPQLLTAVKAEFPGGDTHAAEVVLAITIGVDGRVRDVSVMQSAGAPFDATAKEAAMRFVFEPAEVNGRPVAARIRYVYDFGLSAPASERPPTPSPHPSEVLVRGLPPHHDSTDVRVSAAEASKVSGTEGDPVKVVEDLPGLARPSFGSGQLIVWGGSPTESRTYVDGVEIPALFHGSSLRSTVNGDLVRDVTLTPGSYGADYGRAIGGMVRVETKDLPKSGLHGYVAADTLDGSAMMTAAFGDRVRIAVAGRYGWLDSVLSALDAPNVDQFFAIPRYGDYQGKAQIALRPHESIDVVILGSHDDLAETIPDADPAHQRSQSTSTDYQRLYLRYRRLLDDGASVEAVPFIGHDTSNLNESFGANPAALDESTWRWGLRSSYRARVAEPVTLTLGVELDGATSTLVRTGSLLVPPREGDISVFGQPPGSETSADAWIAGVIDVGPYLTGSLAFGPLSISPGLRVDGFLLSTSRQTPRVGQTPSIGFEQLKGEFEPRISARLRVSSHLSVFGAAGLYSQPPAPSDLSAVFGNPALGPSIADHASVGQTLQITSTLSLETIAFYKWLSGLAVRNPSPSPGLTQALLEEGVGRAYGVQTLLRQQPWHGFFGWVAYTISRSERHDTPNAAWRLLDYDQPHVLTLVASQAIEAWTVGMRFRYARGLPRTPVIGAFYDAKDDLYQPVFGAQNSIRLPDFWQLDLRLDRSIFIGDFARIVVYLEGLNVTNHANGEEYIYNVDYTRRGTITGLPAIAVLGVRVDL